MHALFAQVRQHARVGLEQAQRRFIVTGHQVVDILGQCLHAGAEYRQRLGAGGNGAGVDGFEQAAQGLAIRIGAVQPDDMHRAGGLVQVLAGQPQRGGVARAQRFGRLADLVDIVAKLGGGVFERAAQAGRKPRQPGQVARGGAWVGNSRCAGGWRRRSRLGHGAGFSRCAGCGAIARDREIQGHDGFQCGARWAAAGNLPQQAAGAELAWSAWPLSPVRPRCAEAVAGVIRPLRRS
ncbi:hypothetical protein D3C72_1450530 [compost metagenome]